VSSGDTTCTDSPDTVQTVQTVQKKCDEVDIMNSVSSSSSDETEEESRAGSVDVTTATETDTNDDEKDEDYSPSGAVRKRTVAAGVRGKKCSVKIPAKKPRLNTDDPKSALVACNYPGCDRSFNHLSNLKSHQRSHTEDRPFRCTLCEAAFSRNHDLKRHIKIHSGERPFVCTACGKGFSRLDALGRHRGGNNIGCKTTRKKRRGSSRA